MDDASSALGASVRIVVITLEGIRLKHFFRLGFRAFNNEAGYEALLARLRTVLGMDALDIEIYSDSRLVVSQVQGSFVARDSQMKEYLQVIKQVLGEFSTAKMAQVSRGQNRHAEAVFYFNFFFKEINYLVIKMN